MCGFCHYSHRRRSRVASWMCKLISPSRNAIRDMCASRVDTDVQWLPGAAPETWGKGFRRTGKRMTLNNGRLEGLLVHVAFVRTYFPTRTHQTHKHILKQCWKIFGWLPFERFFRVQSDLWVKLKISEDRNIFLRLFFLILMMYRCTMCSNSCLLAFLSDKICEKWFDMMYAWVIFLQ